MDLKKPASFSEQIQILKNIHNMQIDNIQEAEAFLKYSNYYRFTGYALSFRMDSSGNRYNEGTKFETIQSIYLFDEELRNLLREYLEKVEIFSRTQISYWFSILKNHTPPYDAHYDKNQFWNKKQIEEILKCLEKEKLRNSDVLFIKHHQKNYGDKMPLWVLVDLLSFSNLSKLFSSMYNTEQDVIAKQMGTVSSVLKNHLFCMSNLRNKCAHCSRLYGIDVPYNPPIKLPFSFKKNYPSVSNQTLFAYLLILKQRQPTNKDKNLFADKVSALIKKYEHDITLKQIGAPDNYEFILRTFQ